MDRTYGTHRYAELFPDMARDEFDELVKDVRANGLIEPITTLDGKILDGRSRLKACIEANVDPQFVEHDGRQDPLMFVWTRNIARRHLSTGQRAVVALRFKEMVAKAAKERMSKGGSISAARKSGEGSENVMLLEEGEKGRTVEKLAQMAGVGRGTMQSALVVERDAPELLADIRDKKISPSAAAKKARKASVAQKAKDGWRKVGDCARRLGSLLSDLDRSCMPDLDVVDALREVEGQIQTVIASFNKNQGEADRTVGEDELEVIGDLVR